MPDEITIKSEPESTTANATQQTKSAASVRTQLANLCALSLGISFFLPWAHFFRLTPSGFDLQKLGSEHRILWLIPISCAITIFAGLTKRSQRLVGGFTGILPYLVGIYWYHRLASDLFQMLTYGAYLSLIFGAALLVLSQIKK